MKTFLRLAICTLTLSLVQAGEEAARVEWRELNPAQLQDHVKNVKNFREMEVVLGHTRSTDNNSTWSTARYKFGDSLILVFIGEPENHFAKDDNLRKVSSIYLYRKVPANGMTLVWKVFKEAVPDGRIRSDYIDQPASETKSPNKS